MDRRQRKTKTAIFEAFIDLLAKKQFSQITVGEIIARADIGRATFYAHFETKDDLLKALCDALFQHICLDQGDTELFRCDATDAPFLHLFRHLEKNDNHILDLLSCDNNGIFAACFKESLKDLVKHQLPLFSHRKDPKLPEEFWIDHIASVFTQTTCWWISRGRQQSPEEITEYFLLSV